MIGTAIESRKNIVNDLQSELRKANKNLNLLIGGSTRGDSRDADSQTTPQYLRTLGNIHDKISYFVQSLDEEYHRVIEASAQAVQWQQYSKAFMYEGLTSLSKIVAREKQTLQDLRSQYRQVGAAVDKISLLLLEMQSGDVVNVRCIVQELEPNVRETGMMSLGDLIGEEETWKSYKKAILEMLQF